MKVRKGLILIIIIITITRAGFCQPWYFNNLYNPNHTWSAGFSIASNSGGYIGCAISGDQYNFYQICLLNIQNDGTLISFKNYGEPGKDFWPGENGSFKKDNQSNFYLYGSIDYIGNNVTKGLFMYFDSAGDSIFSKKYEAFYTTGLVGRNCSKTNDNGFILTGEEYIDTAYKYNFCIIKTDSLGNEKWRMYPGTSEWDVPISIIQNSDLGFTIGGLTYSGPQITYDPLIIKTDSLGELEWMLNLGGEYKDDKAMVCNTKDSCIMVLTTYADSMYTPEHAYTKINLVKIDLAGNIIWNKKYGPSKPVNYISNIISLDNGDFMACGYTKELGYAFRIGWLFQFNGNGDSLWYREYYYYLDNRSEAENYLFDISSTEDGGFISTGQVYKLDPPNNVQKMWVLKVDSIGCEIPNCWVGVEEEKEKGGQGEGEKMGKLELWPNPCREILNVKFSIINSGSDYSLSIYDIFGKKVKEINIPGKQGEFQIYIEDYPSGVYLAVLRVGRIEVSNTKFIISK